MTNAEKKQMLEVRLKTLEARGDKAIKSPGVAKKLRRKIAKLTD